MKKNGFTLIELLAVIVILAIIALIATPIILGIINDAREKANERSVELYASAVRNAVAAYQLTGLTAPKSFSDLTIEYDGDVKCTTQELYEDGSFYLEGCKVNESEKEYSYGTKRELAKVCTRQNDVDGFDTVTCTIGENTESFYVMNSYLADVPSNKIVMMTKYNIDPTTYRQSSTAGTVVFSSTRYWPVDSTSNFIYNESSNLYQYISAYETYLKDNGVGSANATLISSEQLKSLGCDESSSSCSSAPAWVYSTSYWTGSVFTGDLVYMVFTTGTFSGCVYSFDGDFGIRPIITISTSEI